ncbi:RAMP superfamily CRISPR-associated protein [Arcicella sp. DC2W]|uniref:RAMP superfamily CRISPR-associated protein n=1 Tax=Arcicella gelida TaxID=2984195 RepID=A0ABU5S2X9_9BACT|nr:RAMP superfamily CRISPR-associated protein [Arcicella sp. DC2W]MEA5402817.1 RAMP superfamily CRISPR-associated protein [Arcicella sp. DC2W]
MKNKMAFTHKYIARIVLEAETGLFVGSGEASLLKDALVQKDIHGLPMIQGTSLFGVLRHSFLDNVTFDTFDEHKEFLINLWGYQFFDKEEKKAFESYYKTKDNKKNAPDGFGSRLKISSAYMLINENEVAEGLTANIPQNILDKYTNLPSRQHVRINDRGVAEKNGLFDNEIVYKGTCFIFELELKGNNEDKKHWDAILANLSSPLFRIGQGTRNGYGQLNIYSLKQRVYDLNSPSDFEAYLNFDPSFNHKNEGFTSNKIKSDDSNLTEYKLILKPDDSFFIFSEGFGDNEADNKPVTEEIAMYKNGTIEFKKQILIPASSIKGALSHRTAFHYNKIEKQFIDEGKGTKGKGNEAVKVLFGYEAEGKEGQRGKVIINDVYYSDEKVKSDKIFNHVAIDRFTGGALDGALFSEKVSYFKEKETSFEFTVYLDYDKEDKIKEAFEETLKDVCKGLLPLGGMTTKGHGIFTGKVLKDTQTIFDYESNN